MEKAVTVRELLSERGDDFGLEIVSGKKGLGRRITVQELNRPGLALAGYTDRFLPDRVQILGETEASYLSSLEAEKRKEAISRVMSFELPVIIVAESQQVPGEFCALSEDRGIPILRTSLSTTPFCHLLTAYLEAKLAPEVSIHATLVDIYGVGLLLTGKSGIGKTETALDLVERGHRLVADDLISRCWLYCLICCIYNFLGFPSKVKDVRERLNLLKGM